VYWAFLQQKMVQEHNIDSVQVIPGSPVQMPALVVSTQQVKQRCALECVTAYTDIV
jgi:hypothetical protein